MSVADFDISFSDDFSRDQYDLLHILGFHHLQHGNPTRAAMIFETILATNPSDAKAAQALACAHLRGEQAELALSVLEKLPSENAGDALTWLLKGQAFNKAGRIAEAARAMRMFIQRRAIEDFKE